jgi:probable rRNA maturation factor
MRSQVTTRQIEKRIQRITTAILRDLGFDLFSVSYLLSDDIYIRELNRRYRKIDKATDVLSFPLYQFYRGELMEPILVQEETVLLGDVVISLDTIRRRTSGREREFNRYLLQAVIHAILHLVGYDHTTLKERRVMREKERDLFNKFREVFDV